MTVAALHTHKRTNSDHQSCTMLLQEHVEGKNLTQMLDMGWQPSHSEVQRIAAELLAILAYLHRHQVCAAIM